MKLSRLFLKDDYVGEKNYIKTQTKYEIARTILYFGISLSLFIAGWITTGERTNLLTIVVILGCLPASKSMVDMIMFLRFKGCSQASVQTIKAHTEGLCGLYDMVFTSYDRNYNIAHITVKGNTICGFTEDAKFAEQEFYKHITDILKVDHFKETSVKIFSDVNKYTERLEQLKDLDTDMKNTEGILNTLKSVSL